MAIARIQIGQQIDLDIVFFFTPVGITPAAVAGIHPDHDPLIPENTLELPDDLGAWFDAVPQIAILSSASSYAVGIRDAFSGQFQQLGGKVSEVIEVDVYGEATPAMLEALGSYDGVTFDVDATDPPSPDFDRVGQDGVFPIALRVTDNLGASSIDTATVEVSNVAATVDAGADAVVLVPLPDKEVDELDVFARHLPHWRSS